MKKSIFLIVPALLLSGCNSQPLHPAHYYRTHKAALRKELARCGKAETLSGNAQKNCETARRVHDGEMAAAGLLSGGSNTILP